MYGPQRCALVKHIVKCCSCLPLSLTDVLSLYRHWSPFRGWSTLVNKNYIACPLRLHV